MIKQTNVRNKCSMRSKQKEKLVEEMQLGIEKQSGAEMQLGTEKQSEIIKGLERDQSSKRIQKSEVIRQADLMEKLTILSDSAKYDVACTSSGIARRGDGRGLGNAHDSGICHAFTSDGRCISLLKILFTNECIYDCKYCINRKSNDSKRVSFTPEEVCTLTIEFYRRNYIEGLFLSSGIIESPDHTMSLIYETLYLLRTKYHFNGYIHIKGIPGTSPELIEGIGYLCDRMSINLELPTAEGLRQMAPNKHRKTILTPMRQIQNGMKESRYAHGVDSMKSRFYLDEKSYYNQLSEIAESRAKLQEYQGKAERLTGIRAANQLAEKSWGMSVMDSPKSFPIRNRTARKGYFVPAGQSTQMIIGATAETDFQIISVTEALYRQFEMKRVFYSAFINVNQDETLPGLKNGEIKRPPLLREHRLYQADFLLRFYGFQAGELLSEKAPNFNDAIDPKCNWAVKHLEEFPVEINRADYYTLLRVPGIGVKSAKRILTARRHGALSFEELKKLGVVLKRAQYFITCKGKMMYATKLEENYITNHLIYNEPVKQLFLEDGRQMVYEQLRLPWV